MKNLIAITAVLLSATIAQADIIQCTFTEPFVDTTYSTTQSTLTYKAAFGDTQVIKNVSFQIKSAGVFELVAKDGTVLQTLTLNNKGSNGMSEDVYPYDVKDFNGLTNKGIGGCESNYLRIIKSN